jgi:hypothetical protein
MIHLITYGDAKYEKSKQKLYNEALNTRWFNTFTNYGPNNLDNSFKRQFKNILDEPRGGGYWIWKPYIIKKKLNEIKFNDILIYLDAGCSINPMGKKRLIEYIKMLNINDSGIISFQLNSIERDYSTKEIFNHFNLTLESQIANSEQIVGGVLIIKKNMNSIRLIDTCIKTLNENPLLFTDHYNKKDQASFFKDNRHDQSIFSIIRKMNNPILIRDETWFPNFGSGESLNYPFWATRIKDKIPSTTK